jgi:acyl carrier protein
MSSVRERIGEILADMGHEARGRLDLDSLTMVQLHERLELTFEVRIRAREITEESFETLDGLEALVSSHLGAGES